MTGELYAVLLEHSILGRMARRVAARRPAARRSRAASREASAGDGLAHAIFGARTLALAGELAPRGVGDWLSGVLIGDEIRAARALGAAIAASTRQSVRVIGDGALVARYSRALEAARASRAEAGPADAAARGLWRIAQHAGLDRTMTNPLARLSRSAAADRRAARHHARRDSRGRRRAGRARLSASSKCRSIRRGRSNRSRRWPRSSASAASSARERCPRSTTWRTSRAAGGRLIVMPHADVAVDARSEAAGAGLRSRGRDADRGVRRARRRRRRAEDVSRRPAAARGAQGWRAVLPQGHAGVRGRRHPARQHGAVLGRRRQRLRHRIESLPAGRDASSTCASAAAAYAAAFRALPRRPAADDGGRNDRRAAIAPDIVALGEAMVEFNQTRAGEPDTYVRGFGGDTSNMAIAAARLGARAAYVTRVGDDAFGRLLLACGRTRASTRAAWRRTRRRRPASIS